MRKIYRVFLPTLILIKLSFGCSNKNTSQVDNLESCDKCEWVSEQEIRKIIHPVIYKQNIRPDERLTESARNKIIKANMKGGIKFWGCVCENNKVYYRLWGANGEDFELELDILNKTQYSITNLRSAKFSHP